jgi:redox-sensitive bicupin YhaK (pirin superfamily)
MHADAHHIPEVVTPVFRLRIIHGHHAGLSSPYTLLTPVQLFHIFLEPYQTLELPAQEMTFVYGLAGQGRTGNKTIGAQSLVIYDPNGDTIALTADKEGLECMFASGAPHHEPLVYGGPFVMTTQEQMIETQQRYATGAMGQLPPFQPQ